MPLDLSRLNIMVVDDNPHMRLLVRSILNGIGVKNPKECGDGAEALSELKHWPADLIITDWVMDPIDGLELTRHLRTDPASPNPFCPVIMLSGHTERHRILEARDAGVTEFLAKPVTLNSLYARIRQVIEVPRVFVRIGRYVGPCRRRKVDDFAGLSRRSTDEQQNRNDADNANSNASSLDQDAVAAQIPALADINRAGEA